MQDDFGRPVFIFYIFSIYAKTLLYKICSVLKINLSLQT